MQLVLPNTDNLQIPLALLEQCYRLWELSDFKTVVDPEFVARLPSGYVDNLVAYHDTIKFYRDAPKRPKAMGRRNRKREEEAKTPGA